MLNSKNTIALPPGVSIREQLELRKMKQNEFSVRMGLSEKHISKLINGQVELTYDVAIRLESVLGIPASFWNNLEVIYREKKARITVENELEEEIEISAHFPYTKMVALGWIPKSNDKQDKVLRLRQYFEVSKLSILHDLHTYGISYRKAGQNDRSDYSLAAWAQKAKLEARKKSVSKVNLQKLKLLIPEIRKLTTESPEVFSLQLTELLASCGIALVVLPQLDSSYLHGATFYDGDRIVMGVTVRGKYADIFWFTLFHEIHHILSGHINGSDEINIEDQEKLADIYARDTLIPSSEFVRFLERDCLSKECIIQFAKQINVSPGIMVGRLQKDNIIPFNQMNDLKVKYPT